MRWPLALIAIATLVAGEAAAEEAPSDLQRLILNPGRPSVKEPEEDVYRFTLNGEHQVRYQAERSFPLIATASAMQRRPGLEQQSLGQNQFVHHWLRLTPRLQLRDVFQVVAQVDLTGLVLGDKAHDTYADETPRNAYNGFNNLQARWLYVEYKAPFGVFRLGQQPNHWGMGILTNDGDHPTLFGDYRYGAISERLLFATKLGGAESHFNLAVAADLVYRDQLARLTRGERAFQGVLAAYWEHDQDKIGVFTTLRHQTTDRDSATPNATYTDALDEVSIDLHGRFAEQVPGHPNAFLYAEAEAAYVIGSTDLVRTAAQAKTQIRSYGGAAKLGIVHRKVSARKIPYGALVGELEVGYASGDADPYDGTLKRFTFDPNHRIGLLLFDEVLRFQTARSATAATDPALTSSARPTAGVDLLPSNGGVFGAQYINPTVTYRPRDWLDLRGGMVVAAATAEVVDPYRVATSGNYVSYRGGNPKKKDLGLELDAGVQARIPLDYGLVGEVGAQAGVLFPGGALEDANDNRLPTQWIAIGRLGLLF